ncbi:UDP-glucose 6-dehydrogenase, partial [Enterococcus hirae]
YKQINTNIQKITHNIKLNNHIKSKFLHTNPNYNNSYFPKNTLTLIKTTQNSNTPIHLIKTTITINKNHKHTITHKIINIYNKSIHNKTITILNLTIKPNTNNIHNTPSLSIIQTLQNNNTQIHT